MVEYYQVKENLNTQTKSDAQTNTRFLLLCKDRKSDALITMLSKMVKATGYDFSRDCRVVYDIKETSLHSYISGQQVDKILAFGLEISDLNLNIELPLYKTGKFENFIITLVDSLEAIQQDKQKKLALWQLLQKHYMTKS